MWVIPKLHNEGGCCKVPDKNSLKKLETSPYMVIHVDILFASFVNNALQQPLSI